MIQFTCPGCKAAHTANSAFADRRAKCVRCGASMYIPREDGEATFAPYGALDRGGQPAAGPASGSGPASGAGEGAGDEADARPAKRRKSKLGLLVGVVLLLLIAGGAAYYFLFMQKPAEPTKPAPAPPAPPAPPEPPPPPYEFVGPPEPPPRPPVPIYINAERLAAELAIDRAGTNERYRGKLLEVQGECAAFRATKVYFRTLPGEEWVTAILPAYNVKYRDPENGRPILPPEAPAVLGGLFMADALPPEEMPVAGRPLAVRGIYSGDGGLTRATLTRLSAPADPTFVGKTLTVVGRYSGASEDDSGFVRLTFFKRVTSDPVTVGGRLTKSAAAGLKALQLRPGDVVAVSGKCSGRVNYEVLLDNCTVVPAESAKLTALQLAAAYEVDVFRYPPIKPDAPVVKASVEEFVNAYRDDPDKANARYQHQVIELTGAVLKTEKTTRTVQFETPTDNPLQLRAVFDPTEFAQLPEDEPVISVRTEFRGAYRGQRVIALTDCRYHDSDADDPKVKKLTTDFLPLSAGRTWEAVRVVYPEPAKPTDPKKPAKPAPAQVVRLHNQVLPDGGVVAHQVQSGTFAGVSLFVADAPEVKWAGKAVKPTGPTARMAERYWLRATDRWIELGTVASPAHPVDPTKGPQLDWKPMLRRNAKAGKSWEVEPGAGRVVTGTVESFFTDDRGREAVRVVAVMTDAKQPDAKTETTVVYVKGVGEASRVVKAVSKGGERVVMEQRLEGEPRVAKDVWGTVAAAGGMAAVPEPPQLKNQPKAPAPK